MASYRWVDETTATVPDVDLFHDVVLDGTLAYNTDTDRAVTWGFYQTRTNTWERYSGDWHLVNPATSPPATAFAGQCASTYDKANSYVLLAEIKSGFPVFETWTWDSTNWTQKSPATVPIAGGSKPGLGFDDGNNVSVMVAPRSGVLRVYSWNGTNWTLLTITGTPPTFREDFGFCYFPPGGYFLFFGGSGSPSPDFTDTWALDIGALTWTQLTPTTTPSATAQSPVTMAYNPLWGSIVSKHQDNLLYLWDGTDWTQIFPSPDLSPSPLGYPLIVFNAAEGRIMLYGGGAGMLTHYYATWFLELVPADIHVMRWW